MLLKIKDNATVNNFIHTVFFWIIFSDTFLRIRVLDSKKGMSNTSHWIVYQSGLHTCWNLTMSALIINLNLAFCFDSNEEVKVMTTSVFQTGNLPHSYRLISVVSHIGSTSSSGKWTPWFQHFINEVARFYSLLCCFVPGFVRCKLNASRKTLNSFIKKVVLVCYNISLNFVHVLKMFFSNILVWMGWLFSETSCTWAKFSNVFLKPQF